MCRPDEYPPFDPSEVDEADIAPLPCTGCGATEVVEITSETQTLLICAECGYDGA